jgi:zinc transport system substrate-binding protein
MSKRIVILLIVLLPALLFAGGKKERVSEKPVVVVSILPHAFFVEELGGSDVDVLTLVGEGQSPHSYEPSPSQMARLSKARVWILSGTEFELALKPKIQSMYPDLVLIDGTDGMVFRQLEEGHHHDHDSLNIDRHTWLGHDQVKVFLGHALAALTDLLPENGKVFEDRHGVLVDRIDELFAELKGDLAPLSGQPVFVYHPAFGYLLDDLNLIQVAVETGGKEPTAKDLASLVELAKREHPKAIFVQKQFPVASAQSVADAVGSAVVPLDPLAYDWLANIRTIGDALLESGGRK